MITIKMGKREIPLMCSTFELIAIQDEIGCTVAQLRDEVFGLHLADPEDDKSWVLEMARDPQRMKKFGTLVRILGNAALEEDGQTADLTDKWVLRNMKPGLVVSYGIAVLAVINEAQSSEVMAEAQEDQGSVDEMVEEENRKKAQEK